MNPNLAVARALVGNAAVEVPDRRRQLNQLTADVRYDYDQAGRRQGAHGTIIAAIAQVAVQLYGT
jgi:hypothetical protein